MTKTTSTAVYNAADRRQISRVYKRVQRARALAKSQPALADRHMIFAGLRAAASSQNIEDGHSTPRDVARAVRKSGNALTA
jgi:hypothetical protein